MTTSSCCASSGDFPNTCLIGACGCAPANSHQVKTCDCGPGKCFDGSACVAVPAGPAATPAPASTPHFVGNDTDVHGCTGSAGYTWCMTKQECIRTWEENCSNSTLEPAARQYCGGTNVAGVYSCDEFIRVTSSLLGGGSTYYDGNGTILAQCPVVGPDSMSEECAALFASKCVEVQVC